MPYISIGRKGLSDELDRLKKSDIEDQYLESWELKEVLSMNSMHVFLNFKH